MVLTLRPLATAAVFFANGQCRRQLFGGSELARRVSLRLWNCVLWAIGERQTTGGGDRVRFNPELAQVEEFRPGSAIAEPDAAPRGRSHSAHSGGDDDEGGAGDHGSRVGAGMPYERMD